MLVSSCAGVDVAVGWGVAVGKGVKVGRAVNVGIGVLVAVGVGVAAAKLKFSLAWLGITKWKAQTIPAKIS